jgi:two-component system, chemotaxis family, protein-glutamate methylesterase/glutaminase
MAMRVAIVESDVAQRRALESRLMADPRIDITGSFGDLTETFHEVEHRPPHMVLVGAMFPRLPEFDVMELLFRTLAVKWRVVATEAQQRMLNRLRGQRPPFDYLDPTAESLDLFDIRLRDRRAQEPVNAQGPAGLQRGALGRTDGIVLIGSSTGGVDALMKILGRFPANCPPTLIVQHIGAPFGEGLAGLLDRAVAPTVRLAGPQERLQAGMVLLAPGAERHLVLDGKSGTTARLVEGPKISGHRPSVDALFRSALPVASRVTAAILTGMGSDGAEGITALRAAGAMTIGQDRKTSLVYGMPGVAQALGGIVRELPLNEIGQALMGPAEMKRAL